MRVAGGLKFGDALEMEFGAVRPEAGQSAHNDPGIATGVFPHLMKAPPSRMRAPGTTVLNTATFTTMRLPGGENAIVDPRKLLDYCLNLNHDKGKHKARVFKSAMDLTAKDSDVLHRRLLLAARENEVSLQIQISFGTAFRIDFPMEHNARSAIVRSSWLLEPGSILPRLLTCFILSKGAPHARH